MPYRPILAPPAHKRECSECHVTTKPHRTWRNPPMSDRYQSLIHTSVGQLLAKNLGLPNPVTLDRYHEGDPLVDGTVVVGGEGRLGTAITNALDSLGISSVKSADEG